MFGSFKRKLRIAGKIFVFGIVAAIMGVEEPCQG